MLKAIRATAIFRNMLVEDRLNFEIMGYELEREDYTTNVGFTGRQMSMRLK